MSNFFFYSVTAEYGADSSLLKPFLHTWSLSVEEQFYLIFPVIVIVAFKFFNKYLFFVLILLSLISLIFSDVMSTRDFNFNFYLPFSRFWELAVGSMLAYREIKFGNKRYIFWEHLLPVFGFVLIICSIMFFNSKTAHPSFYTVIPIIGTSLIIAFSSKIDFVGKVLSFRPLVWIGLISYSAYLWHFTVFAFSRLGMSKHTNYDKLEWIAITLMLSIMSYRLVEMPFRKKISLKTFITIICASLFLIVIFTIYVVINDGVATKGRLGFSPNFVQSIKPTYLFGDKGCSKGKIFAYGNAEFCILGKEDNLNLDFILLGDSHAMHAQSLFQKLSIEMGLKGLFGGVSGCPALLGVYPVRGMPHPNNQSRKCFDFNQRAFNLIKERGIKKVFLISRWDYYVDGGDKGDINNITDVNLEAVHKERSRLVYDEGVARTVSLYSKIGVKVVVLLQIPHQEVNVKRIVEDLMSSWTLEARKQILEESKENFLLKKEHVRRQYIANESWLKQAQSNSDYNLLLIDPINEFCGEKSCAIFDRGLSFYTDNDHASEYGFNRLESKFRSVMR